MGMGKYGKLYFVFIRRVCHHSPTSHMQTPSKKLNHALLLLLVMGGFGVMGGSLLSPALPALLEPFGVDRGALGLVLGVYTFAAALGLPFIGFLIDVWGRKVTGILCLVIDGTFGLMCIFAPSFGILLLFRFFQGIGIGGLIPVAMTVISDWYQGDRRLWAMGMLSGTISLSAVFVPLIGGFLGGLDWRYPFMVYGISLLIALLFLLFIPETGKRYIKKPFLTMARRHFAHLFAAMRSPKVQHVFSQCLMLYFLLYAMVTFLPIYLSQVYGFFGIRAGLMLSLMAITGAVMSSKSVAVRKLTAGYHVLIGFILTGAAMILLPFWPDPLLLAISLVTFGAGFGILQPSVYNEASNAGPEELTGSVVCLFNTVKFIGMSLSPVILGFVQRSSGIESVFWVAGALSLVWVVGIIKK